MMRIMCPLIFKTLFILTFLFNYIENVKGGCRSQESNECESLCRKSKDGSTKCELRIASILPNLTDIEASLERVS